MVKTLLFLQTKKIKINNFMILILKMEKLYLNIKLQKIKKSLIFQTIKKMGKLKMIKLIWQLVRMPFLESIQDLEVHSKKPKFKT